MNRLFCTFLFLISFTIFSTQDPLSQEIKDNIEILRNTGKCPKCNLKDADLRDPIKEFQKRSLNTKINLTHANCENANLSDLDLHESTFAFIQAQNANFSNTNLSNCSLDGASLDNANLSNAQLANNSAVTYCLPMIPDFGWIEILKMRQKLIPSFKGANLHGAHINQRALYMLLVANALDNYKVQPTYPSIPQHILEHFGYGKYTLEKDTAK